LQSNNEIYGVFLDKKANELIEKAKKLKASEADEIKVELLGEISTKMTIKFFGIRNLKSDV
jgi:predicted nucleotide-binding protein (sugar kinase/HSP70/actin superfamily)